MTCHSGGTEIECATWAGRWNGRCDASLEAGPPDFSDLVWEGETEGYIVDCASLYCAVLSEARDEMHCPDISSYWVAEPPEGAGPVPRELAKRAVAAMDLDMGLARRRRRRRCAATRRGIVGMPI